MRAIMRADVIARRTRPARPTHLIIEPRQVRVRADVPDIGQIETVLDAELEGRPIAIALDAKRALTILRGWASVSNGKRQRSSTLAGAEQTIIRVGEPDKAIMIQPADITAAGRFAILMPMLKPNIEVIEPALPAHSRKETYPAEPAHRPTPPPAPIVVEQLPPALPAVSSAPVRFRAMRHELRHGSGLTIPSGPTIYLPGPVAKPKPEPVAKPVADRLTIHPKLELTPAKASRIVEHWSAVLEFAQTGTLTRANGARLVHYDTCTVLDLGGKRNKYTQWKASLLAQHEEVIRAYVNENR